MKSNAKTVEEYLKSLPSERREAKIREPASPHPNSDTVLSAVETKRTAWCLFCVYFYRARRRLHRLGQNKWK